MANDAFESMYVVVLILTTIGMIHVRNVIFNLLVTTSRAGIFDRSLSSAEFYVDRSGIPGMCRLFRLSAIGTASLMILLVQGLPCTKRMGLGGNVWLGIRGFAIRADHLNRAILITGSFNFLLADDPIMLRDFCLLAHRTGMLVQIRVLFLECAVLMGRRRQVLFHVSCSTVPAGIRYGALFVAGAAHVHHALVPIMLLDLVLSADRTRVLVQERIGLCPISVSMSRGWRVRLHLRSTAIGTGVGHRAVLVAVARNVFSGHLPLMGRRLYLSAGTTRMLVGILIGVIPGTVPVGLGGRVIHHLAFTAIGTGIRDLGVLVAADLAIDNTAIPGVRHTL